MRLPWPEDRQRLTVRIRPGQLRERVQTLSPIRVADVFGVRVR